MYIAHLSSHFTLQFLAPNHARSDLFGSLHSGPNGVTCEIFGRSICCVWPICQSTKALDWQITFVSIHLISKEIKFPLFGTNFILGFHRPRPSHDHHIWAYFRAAQAHFQAIFTDRRGGPSGCRKYHHLHDQEPNFIVRIRWPRSIRLSHD